MFISEAYPDRVTNPLIIEKYMDWYSRKLYIEEFKETRNEIIGICKKFNIELFEFSGLSPLPEIQTPNHIEAVPREISARNYNRNLSLEEINYYYARDYDPKLSKLHPHPGIYFQNKVVESYKQHFKI